jgi:hypothetical protein
MAAKKCTKCGKKKPPSDFYAHPFGAGGRDSKCKECAKLVVKAAYRANREARREYDRRRQRTPERRRKQQETGRRMIRKYPEKHAARLAVKRAVASGRLVSTPCEMCGHPKTEAHHDDYSKPLAVRWLCCRCHKRVHGRLIEG